MVRLFFIRPSWPSHPSSSFFSSVQSNHSMSIVGGWTLRAYHQHLLEAKPITKSQLIPPWTESWGPITIRCMSYLLCQNSWRYPVLAVWQRWPKGHYIWRSSQFATLQGHMLSPSTKRLNLRFKIYSLEHCRGRVVGSGGYLSNRVVFDTWQTVSPNCLWMSKRISLWHLSLLSHRSYFSTSENILTFVLFDQRKIVSYWSSHIPI